MATIVLFDLRVFLTVLKIHKTQLALPKWENVGNIFKYGLLLIDFFCFEKNRSNVEPVKPKSIYVIQYGWA